jgi:predicted RNA-binding protein YlxR (DUF448 family)
MDSRQVTTITCVFCRRKEQGDDKQPKLLAKRLCWKHGKGRGSWICPECRAALAPVYELEQKLKRRGYEDE